MNRRNWELYKNSQAGQETVDCFERRDLASIFALVGDAAGDSKIERVHFFYDLIKDDALFSLDEIHKEDFADFLNGFNPKDIRALNASIDVLSVALNQLNPFFKPLLNSVNFDTFWQACSILSIELPPIPRTKNYLEYLLFYYDICDVLNNWQEENEFTNAELFACLYDYVPNYLMQGKDETNAEITTLPAPTNIWLVGANKQDIAEIESGELTESVWQCNECTQTGDIAVIYARTPHSCIHSIWRASSGGYFSPFDYYQNRTKIQDGVSIPHITLNELKAHPYFSKLPIVRKNMQGVNGVELSVKDYSELLKLVAEKGGDVGTLPKLFDTADYEMPDVKEEKDVEEKILMPLLEKLGYCRKDYIRQLVQQVGRNDKAIPDFVFMPTPVGEHLNTAPFLIEAKYDMRTILSRQKAINQAHSYALALQTKYFAVCDKERLMVFKKGKSCFDLQNPVFEIHWAVINTDADVFQKLKKCIGKENLKQYK